VQDAFGDVRVYPILDSGMPFSDKFWPVCLQKKFRDTWGLDGALPPDCKECFHSDGGGLLSMADFLMEKHPHATLAAISSLNDEVIRLFFSAGLKNCAGIETSDPVAITLGQFDPMVYLAADQYAASMEDALARYKTTHRLAAYLMSGALHQHTFRNRFYEPVTKGKTIAEFVTDFLNDQIDEIRP
jgi:hypothetical protein